MHAAWVGARLLCCSSERVSHLLSYISLSISKAGCIQQHCLSLWSLLSSTCCPELPQQIISCKFMWDVLWDYRGGHLLQHVVCPQLARELPDGEATFLQPQTRGVAEAGLHLQCLDSLLVLWAPQWWHVVKNQTLLFFFLPFFFSWSTSIYHIICQNHM